MCATNKLKKKKLKILLLFMNKILKFGQSLQQKIVTFVKQSQKNLQILPRCCEFHQTTAEKNLKFCQSTVKK